MNRDDRDYNKLFRHELRLMPKARKGYKQQVFFGLIIIVLVFLIAILSPGISLEKEIIVIGKDASPSVVNLGHLGSILPFPTDKERVNFLFLGIAGEGNPAPQLTDTIIIINSTPKAENPIAISIPRDLLIKYPEKNYYTKINALYKYGGIDAIKSSIAEITGLKTDYYLVTDLGSVKKIIDQFDGIDVDVKEDIYDPQFPAPYNSYEIFSLKKGIQHLDGETALKYIRTRNQPEGDFSRIERQQQVISALKDKIFSLNLILNFPKILGLWNILQDNSYTNIGLTEIKYAWNLIKNTNLDEINFNTITSPLVISHAAVLSGETASTLIPRLGIDNYSEIKEYVNNLISNQ